MAIISEETDTKFIIRKIEKPKPQSLQQQGRRPIPPQGPRPPGQMFPGSNPPEGRPPMPGRNFK